MAKWRDTARAIAEDRRRLRAYAHEFEAGDDGRAPLLLFGLIAMLLYRVAHFLYANNWRVAARLVWVTNICITGADLDAGAEIGKGTIIPHPRCVSIYGNVGENAVFQEQSGLGSMFRSHMADIGAGRGKPVLDDEVWVGPGSVVLGPVAVGKRARIGPRCIVVKEVPPAAEVAPVDWPMHAGAGDDGAGGAVAPPLSTLAAKETWRETRQAIAQDRLRLRAYLRQREMLWMHPGAVASLLYRVGHFLHTNGWRRLAGIVWGINYKLTGADLDPAARIGGGLALPNPLAVSIRGVLGINCTVSSQVAIGARVGPDDTDAGWPVVGDAVEIGPGALLVGSIKVGRGARIAPRCLVANDVPAAAEFAPLEWRAMKL
jgi:serine O-acetyltransferase